MKKYSVASLVVAMQPKEKTLSIQSRPYELKTERKADIIISVSSDSIREISDDSNEYIYTGAEFYRKLLDFGGMVLHASAVVLDGRAYLFSAKSGVGKSTHTSLWLEYFGKRAYILNDDKPALRLINNRFMVCGTPWSGKTNNSRNEIVPLGAIAFIKPGIKNVIRRLCAEEALPLMLSNTLRPSDKAVMLMTLLDRLLCCTPIYKLHCDMSMEAVECSYNGMKG
ncbi:MAG: hypothetical protein PHD46_06790 [Eubacteriales bacterium]|nr:hypothetical protein [Eubacteriales bacterium]MDD4422725.1 hypothetical protein [Eubacteriales bacterium]